MREHAQNSGVLETMTDMPQPSMNGNGHATTAASGLTNKSSYGSGGSAVHSYEVRCWVRLCILLRSSI
jgi:hypothetical protein